MPPHPLPKKLTNMQQLTTYAVLVISSFHKRNIHSVSGPSLDVSAIGDKFQLGAQAETGVANSAELLTSTVYIEFAATILQPNGIPEEWPSPSLLTLLPHGIP